MQVPVAYLEVPFAKDKGFYTLRRNIPHLRLEKSACQYPVLLLWGKETSNSISVPFLKIQARSPFVKPMPSKSHTAAEHANVTR